MASLEERVARIEGILGRIFRPGGTIAIRDDAAEAATLLIGGASGDLGSVLMSAGLSVKEIEGEVRSVVTPSAIGLKDENDVLRLLITHLGIIFLDESGSPRSLISAQGIENLGGESEGHQ